MKEDGRRGFVLMIYSLIVGSNVVTLLQFTIQQIQERVEVEKLEVTGKTFICTTKTSESEYHSAYR